MAESLYRKYRPQIFEDVVGQEHIERTLKNAIEHDKVSHAYLFCGPRGTGKTTTARLLAKALLCEKGPTPDPDGTCEDCRMIANGEHPDVNELDAASRTGVENVREEIIGRVQFAPTRGRYKVYIIDEVHMLSPAAFNALLKTLEEPPSHVVFILCTTDPQKVPETIHSRCQRFDFRRISNEALVSRLGAVCVAEGVEFEGEALDLIAHRSDGGMRNALTSLEQVIAFSEGTVTLESTERLLGSMDASDLGEIVGAIGRRDVAACFRWTAEFVETGADLAQFTRDLAAHVRNLYVMTLTDAEIALEVGASERREMEAELPLFAPDRLARLLGILGDLGNELKTSTNPRLSFEIALTRMVRPDSDLTMESLAERVEALESGCSAVAHVTSTPAGATAGVAQAAMPATRDGGYAVRAEAQAVQQTQPIQRAQQTQRAGSAVQTAPVAEQRAAEPQRMPAMERRSVEPQQTPQVEQRFVEPQPARSVEQPVVQTAADTSVAAGAQLQPAVASAGARSGSVSEQLAASLSNPASLQRVWQAALTTLKKEKAAYGVLFLNTKAVFDAAAGSLSIEFPAENTFAFNAAQKPDVQTAVASALARACGEDLGFSYSQAGKRVSAGAATGAAMGASAGAAAGAAAVEASAAQAQPVAREAAQPVEQQRSAEPVRTQPVHEERRAEPVAQPAYEERRAEPEPARQAVHDPRPAAAPAAAAQGGGFAAASAAPSYDDVVPYDDDAVPYDDAAAMSYDVPPWEEAAPARRVETRPPAEQSAPHRQDEQSASRPQAEQTAAPVRSAQPTPSAQADPDDLQAILAAGFGDGVTFQEVRE
ncbi:MAG: DNA polymerase III subunit gamma/tau [Eggerthellaceae bacterium]